MNLESRKSQEITLVLLNIAVLAALFVVHIVFLFEIGFPSKLLLITLAARFVLLIGELVWLQAWNASLSQDAIRIHSKLSIAANICFAFIASTFGGTADSHYSVLMIIPLIQVAYRFSLLRTIGITLLTIILTFVQVLLFFRQKPPIDYGELFEAATVSLIFFVVGVVVWLLVSNLRGEEEKLTASLAELRATQARLVSEEKLAAIGQLSSSIAHEIRNPVAMIASSLELASKQPKHSELSDEMYGIAAQEASRLEVLTSEFLTFARTKEPEFRENSLSETLEYVASLAKARLSTCEIDVKVVCSPELSARFDESMIRQALLNLVINSIDATPPHGTITMSGFSRESGVGFSVENDGKPIPEESIERIFEPFFTNKSTGTGLGLAIVRKIARMHHGDVELAKNAEGCVRFEILISDEPGRKGKSNNA